MSERHNDLSTADLADQRQRDGDRAVDPSYRDDVDARDADTRDDAVRDEGVVRDDRAAYDEHDEHAAAREQAPDLTPEPDMAHDGDRRWGERDLGRDLAEDRGQVPAPDGRSPAPATVDGSGTGTTVATIGPLLASEDAERFRARWTDAQTGFVDAPRRAVEHADRLVAELMQHLAKSFADERAGLERQWDRGDDVSTDDLRTAFQRYRSFFERLLAN